MSTTLSVTNEALSKLQHIIDANKSVDWRAFPFDDPRQRRSLTSHGGEGEQAELIPLLKAYQRVLRILPAREDHRALPLLRAGLHSAVQIAGLPKPEFDLQWEALFPGEAAVGEAVYQSALGRRSYVLLQHINLLQRNEPHYRAARFR